MFYHGSFDKLEEGTLLVPQLNGYTQQSDTLQIEELFEEEKPYNKISRKECVFLCDNIEDIDNCGGYTDYIYSIEVTSSNIEKSDLSWYTKAFIQLEEGNIKGARLSAQKYWSGEVLEGVFEYRTKQCKIFKSIK